MLRESRRNLFGRKCLYDGYNENGGSISLLEVYYLTNIFKSLHTITATVMAPTKKKKRKERKAPKTQKDKRISCMIQFDFHFVFFDPSFSSAAYMMKKNGEKKTGDKLRWNLQESSVMRSIRKPHGLSYFQI